LTLSNDEFQARMIDYLYGELEGDELRAFEDQLSESDAGRRELAALQSTLRIARDGLAQAVYEPPPARVRSAVLAAAAAQPPASEPLRTTQPTRVDEQVGFWHWLRAPWLLPTLGVAAAVGLVVFGRGVESPSVHIDGHPAQPAQAAPEQGPVAAPPPAAANESSQLEEKAAEPPVKVQRAPDKTARSPGMRAQADGFAVPPPAWNAQRESPAHAQPAPRSVPAPARERYTEPEQAAPPVQDKAPRATPAAPAARASSEIDDAFRRPANRGQPSRAEATVSRTLGDLIRRAGENVAARRWQQAAADYRELLRRYPSDARTEAWKKQLALVTQALRARERDPR